MAQLTRSGQSCTLVLTAEEADTLDGLEQRGDGVALQELITSWIAAKERAVLLERLAALTPGQRAAIRTTLRGVVLERPR